MTSEELMNLLNAGEILDPATPEGVRMNEISCRAREICSLVNRESSDVARIGEPFSELIGEPVMVVAGNLARPIRSVSEAPRKAAQ